MGLFSSKSDPKLLTWEQIKSNGSAPYSTVWRTKVPGGWLITIYSPNGPGLTFMPDPQHIWDGNSAN